MKRSGSDLAALNVTGGIPVPFLIAVDRRDVEANAIEAATYMSDAKACTIAERVCDILYEAA